jgi:hypothetical protein
MKRKENILIISILGQDYDYGEVDAKSDIRMVDMDGYCDGYGKIIRINNSYNSNIPTSISDLEAYKRQVRRHEVIHAFFEESGLEEFKGDELLVEWIAKQFPKMEKVFQVVGAL